MRPAKPTVRPAKPTMRPAKLLNPAELLDWIYPPRCMACQNILPMEQKRQRALCLCADCESMFIPLAPPLCTLCGAPTAREGRLCSFCQEKDTVLDGNYAAYAYADLIRELFHAMKFRSQRHIAAGFGALLAEHCVNHPTKRFTGGLVDKDVCMEAGGAADKEASMEAAMEAGMEAGMETGDAYDLLVPVPIHPRKRRARGFNQAELIAKALSPALGIPLAADLLRRIRNTPPQSGLSQHQRKENTRGAFAFNPRFDPRFNPRLNPRFDVVGKKICLVDDIYTTGATMDACTEVLKQHGAAFVYGLTFSVAVSKNFDN